MTSSSRATSVILILAASAAVGVAAWSLLASHSQPPTPNKPVAPATVDKVVKEDDLNTITLTEEAEKRIGLTVATVDKKSVPRTRMYGGEATVPIGKAIIVSAPFAGILQAAPGNEVKAGQTVRAGQAVFHLMPLLTPDGRATLSAALADAEGQVNNAKTQMDLSQIALNRAKRVLSEGAGSQRQVDEAQAAFDVAAKTLQAATTRQTILKHAIGDTKAGTAAPIPIEAPMSGLLRTVSAVAGQPVPSNAVLFEVIDVSTIWVRVPLPVGDLELIDPAAPANVGRLSTHLEIQTRLARPIAAPPSANAISAAVDVFYELPNTDGKLAPGQRLGVTIPLKGARENLTVPWSALVFDIHGGTWLYEQVGPHRYARRRATVSYTSGTDGVLSAGPAAGAKVVSAGAQELFGAETGFPK